MRSVTGNCLPCTRLFRNKSFPRRYRRGRRTAEAVVRRVLPTSTPRPMSVAGEKCMEVKCPNCSSRFNLPDAVAKPGAKLRCSVCKEIFRLGEAENTAPQPSPKGFDLDFGGNFSLDEKPEKNRRRPWLIAVMLLVLMGGAAGGWWYYLQHLRGADDIQPQASLEKKVQMLTMRNVRQYYVKNEKIGQVFVVEGQVVNEFPTPKELIEVEAVIYDKDKKPLAAKNQLAGTTLSLFQLEVLGEKELESILNNNVELLTKNTNIQPGGSVPFMVLFYAPPPVAEFGVRIVDVRDVENQQ